VALTHKHLNALILHFKKVFMKITFRYRYGLAARYCCCELSEKIAVKKFFLALLGFGTGILDPGSGSGIWIWDPYLAEDLDPDPHSTYADPKHCKKNLDFCAN